MRHYVACVALLLMFVLLSGCGQHEAREYCPHGAWTNHRSVFPCGEHGIPGKYFMWAAIIAVVLCIALGIRWEVQLRAAERRGERTFWHIGTDHRRKH